MRAAVALPEQVEETGVELEALYAASPLVLRLLSGHAIVGAAAIRAYVGALFTSLH